MIALLAALMGKVSCSALALLAEHEYEFLSGFIALKGGPPSHDSFSDLFNSLDLEQLSSAVPEFARTLLPGFRKTWL